METKMNSLLRNKKVYVVLGVLLVGGILLLWALNSYLMPMYTNYHEGVTVPNITQLPLERAKEVLASSGLRYEVNERRTNMAFPANYVIDQNPVPSEIVKPDRKIYLTVNVASTPTVIVPDVRSLSLRNAIIQLESAGLKVGSVSYESSRFKNTVLRQSVTPDTTIKKGTTVNLVVSDGLGEKMVKIPEIIGLELTKAQQKLREAGLRIKELHFKPSNKVPPSVILDYSPKPEKIAVGESINLIISERPHGGDIDAGGMVKDSAPSNE